jgi:hypothetical protein
MPVIMKLYPDIGDPVEGRERVAALDMRDTVTPKSVANPWRDPKIAVLAGQNSGQKMDFLTAW